MEIADGAGSSPALTRALPKLFTVLQQVILRAVIKPHGIWHRSLNFVPLVFETPEEVDR